MTDALWILVIVALVGLVVLQFASARAARKIGGKSSNAVIMLRLLNAALVVGVVVWLLVRGIGR